MVATRYMLDHLDQVGRSCVVIARSAPTAAQEVLERFAGWAADDPDARSITLHLSAVVSEQRQDYVAAQDAYSRSLDGLPRRAATVVADALGGLARSPRRSVIERTLAAGPPLPSPSSARGRDPPSTSRSACFGNTEDGHHAQERSRC